MSANSFNMCKLGLAGNVYDTRHVYGWVIIGCVFRCCCAHFMDVAEMGKGGLEVWGSITARLENFQLTC
jgi:hypothetical protein